MDSLHQTFNGLVGNIDWGESLSIVACEFPARNSSSARRRAASAWLAVEHISQDYLTIRCFEAFNLTQVLTGSSYTFEVRNPVFTLHCSLLRVCFVHLVHGWCKCESAQPITYLES